MATTSKRKRKEIKEVDSKSFLNASDLLVCETMSRDVLLKKVETGNEELHLTNMILEFKNLEHRIIRQKEKIAAKAREYENMKGLYITTMTEVWSKYGVEYKDGIGYDNLTGEIKK